MEHPYPEVEVTDVRDKTDLVRYTKDYEHLHKSTPYAMVSGVMQDSTGNTVHCYRYLIADCKGRKFTVATPEGYATLRVPEHGSVTVHLDANEYEN